MKNNSRPKIIIKKKDLINSDIWKLFPVINVDKVKDIPKDYPGAMGVPITALDKIGRNDGHSGLHIIDMTFPRLESGRQVYRRLIVRNLNPDIPDEIDLVEWITRCGVNMDVVIM